MYENGEKERSWGDKFLALNHLYDDESTEETLWANIEKIRTQKNGGRSYGVTIVLNPQMEQYYCSAYNRPGFVVNKLELFVSPSPSFSCLLLFQFKAHLPVNTPSILEQSHPLSPGTEMLVSITPSAIFADKDIRGFAIVRILPINIFNFDVIN